MTPQREHVRFFPSAAAAQQAGFRACKRCRPDAAPGSPEWDGRADVVARAMRLIGDGVVDRDGVPGLAARVGYSVRQLQRMLLAEVGAGPIAIARAQRAQTARVLIETTALSMTEVAFAAGFSSVRQFNETIKAVFATAPSELRKRARPHGPAGVESRSRGALGERTSRSIRPGALTATWACRARFCCACRSVGRCAPTTCSATLRPPRCRGSRRFSATPTGALCAWRTGPASWS